MAKEKINTDTYHGVGPVSSGIGNAFNAYVLTGMVAALAFAKKPEVLFGRALSVVAAFVAGISGYLGYRQAKVGHDQFNALKEQNTALVAKLQEFVAYGGVQENAQKFTMPSAAMASSVPMASEFAASPVSIEEPAIKEPVIKAPTIAPAPTRSFADTAPAPKSHVESASAPIESHAAAVEAAKQEPMHAAL